MRVLKNMIPRRINKYQQDILYFVGLHGYITGVEATLICGNRTTAYNQLRLLREKNYLSTFDTGAYPGLAYWIPKSGKAMIQNSPDLRDIILNNYYPSKFNFGTFCHHSYLAQVHIVLKQILSERYISFIPYYRSKLSQEGKIFDAELVFFKEEEKKIGIEIEITPKSKERRKKQAEEITSTLNDRLNGVIIFYINEFYKNCLKDLLREEVEYKNVRKPIFFCHLGELREKKKDAFTESIYEEKEEKCLWQLF